MSEDGVILVGVDGSPESLGAVDWAVARAACEGWRVHILCAYSLPSFTTASLDGGYAALDDTAVRAGAQAVVDEAIARVQDKGVTVTSSLETGDPAGVLVDLSEEAVLTVVGTRGGGGFADRLLGTVSSALPAHAHCPTIVVPRHTEGAEYTPARRIVGGVDGSEARGVDVAVDGADDTHGFFSSRRVLRAGDGGQPADGQPSAAESGCRPVAAASAGHRAPIRHAMKVLADVEGEQ